MCWSFRASIITWIFATIVGIYLLSRKRKNDTVMGCLVLVYSSMQLWESLMWYDQKCGAVNLVGTKMAYIALWTHVLAVAIGLYLEYDAIVPLFIGIGLLILAFIMKPDTWTCSLPGENKHLVWGFDPSYYTIVFTIAIILCLIYIKPFSTAIIVSLLFLVSFFLSNLYGNKSKTTGSFWCWVCATFSCIFIFVNSASS